MTPLSVPVAGVLQKSLKIPEVASCFTAGAHPIGVAAGPSPEAVKLFQCACPDESIDGPVRETCFANLSDCLRVCEFDLHPKSAKRVSGGLQNLINAKLGFGVPISVEIDELRTPFLVTLSARGNQNVHPCRIERLKGTTERLPPFAIRPGPLDGRPAGLANGSVPLLALGIKSGRASQTGHGAVVQFRTAKPVIRSGVTYWKMALSLTVKFLPQRAFVIAGLVYATSLQLRNS